MEVLHRVPTIIEVIGVLIPTRGVSKSKLKAYAGDCKLQRVVNEQLSLNVSFMKCLEISIAVSHSHKEVELMTVTSIHFFFFSKKFTLKPNVPFRLFYIE